jgi:hypothetical protein
MTFNLVNIKAPCLFMNAELRVLFAKRTEYDSIAIASPLSFAPGLLDIITLLVLLTTTYLITLLVVSFKV